MAFEHLVRFELSPGNHPAPGDGLCMMEAVAWFNGDPHSDQPRCVCPAIAHYCRAMNDQLHDQRQDLIPFIPRVVDTLDSRAVFLDRMERLVGAFQSAGGGRLIAERARRRFATCLYPFHAPSFSLGVICDGIVLNDPPSRCFALLESLINLGRPSGGFSRTPRPTPPALAFK